MKNSLLLFSLLGSLAISTQTIAAFQSAKLNPNNPQPQFPPGLIRAGVAEAEIILVIKINPEGAVTDALALAYSHESLIGSCREAIKDWKATPARLDGVPVPVQMELTIDFKREGFVETNSINITQHFLNDGFKAPLAKRLVRRVRQASEIDSRPTPVATVAPVYPKQAEDDGIRGKVRVHFFIDEQGTVQFPSVDPGADLYLSDLAVTALRNWRFEAATRRGKPVMVAATQAFNFNSPE